MGFSNVKGITLVTLELISKIGGPTVSMGGNRELVPDPDSTQQGFELHRSWIETDNYLPTAYTQVNCDSLVWKLNQKEVYQMVLDTYLAPNLVSTKSVLPYVTQVSWSPAGMLSPRGCLLASVTNYGCVVVQASEDKRWKILVNISSLWTEKCTSNWDHCDSYVPKDQFDILQSRANKLKATSITWSSFIGDRKYCVLIVAMQDGTLLFWQINVPKSIRDKDVEPKLLLEYDTHQYHITTMHWMTKDKNSGFLCVGDIKGIIKIYLLKWQEEEEELSCTSVKDIWPHNDRIQVTRLCIMHSVDSEITIVAIKGSFVIAIALDAESFVVKTKSYHVGNLSINGIVLLDNNSLLVVTHSGRFSLINISRTLAELEIKAQSLNSIMVPKSAYYGISSSINKAIFCLITSFSTMYDHLIQREPAQITFFKICGLVDPYQSLLSNPSLTLTRHWDYLEIIRLQGPPFPDVEKEEVEELSSYHLKIRMWLCRFAVMQEDPEEEAEKRSASRQRLKHAERLVLIQHFYKYVKKFTSQNSLSNQDRESLGLILSWMKKIEPERSPIVNAILKCLADIQDLPDHEFCTICQQECLAVENPTESKCVAGHVLPRCSVSLLQCPDIPFWICKVCHAIANLNADVGEPALCVYCDSLLQLTSNALLKGEGEEEEEEEVEEEKEEEQKGKEEEENEAPEDEEVNELKIKDQEEKDKKQEDRKHLLRKEMDDSEDKMKILKMKMET